MGIDQSEIDALLAEANALVDGAIEEPAPPPPPPPLCTLPADPRLDRIRRLRVPLIVQLATRRMSIASVRQLSVGSIIEFEKSVEDPLDLLVNDRVVGQGACVRVGENFGLRILKICDKPQRVRSLGR